MSNNSTDNQNAPNTPATDEDQAAEAAQTTEKEAQVSNTPKPQVTTNPGIKNY